MHGWQSNSLGADSRRSEAREIFFEGFAGGEAARKTLFVSPSPAAAGREGDD
jgi:hypothetical protein